MIQNLTFENLNWRTDADGELIFWSERIFLPAKSSLLVDTIKLIRISVNYKSVFLYHDSNGIDRAYFNFPNLVDANFFRGRQLRGNWDVLLTYNIASSPSPEFEFEITYRDPSTGGGNPQSGNE